MSFKRSSIGLVVACAACLVASGVAGAKPAHKAVSCPYYDVGPTLTSRGNNPALPDNRPVISWHETNVTPDAQVQKYNWQAAPGYVMCDVHGVDNHGHFFRLLPKTVKAGVAVFKHTYPRRIVWTARQL